VRVSVPAGSPPGVVRIALSHFRWPLDPALAEGRDETTLARALYATPLRTDPVTGAVVPGLCNGWKASSDFRSWRFTCRAAPAIAAALRRLVRLRDAPAHWLFAGAVDISAGGTSLRVRLRDPWRRFPYALTAVGAAPRSVPGPFRPVHATALRVVARQPGLTLVFRRMEPLAAARAFRRGALDEAPVPAGDVVALRTELGSVVRVRRLLGLDVVVFRGLDSRLRRAYWYTAARSDYEQLVPELPGSSSYGLVGADKADPAQFRRTLKTIPSLPRVRVRIAVPNDDALRLGWRTLYGVWRDVGLGPELVSRPPFAAFLLRLAAAYPQEEALPAELVLRLGVGSHADLLRALAVSQQHAQLDRVDAGLRTSAQIVPVAWVSDARLVSPRLEGWREDALGNVDYGAVRLRASSRRPSP
jgi:hypothetical protein